MLFFEICSLEAEVELVLSRVARSPPTNMEIIACTHSTEDTIYVQMCKLEKKTFPKHESLSSTLYQQAQIKYVLRLSSKASPDYI